MDADGKVLTSDERKVQPGDGPTSHRFELASPKAAADKVTLRCTFGGEKMETPLDKVLLVKAHETDAFERPGVLCRRPGRPALRGPRR